MTHPDTTDKIRNVSASGNVVAVFGSSDGVEGEVAYELARATGKELARLGYVVATGGYGGMMEAASRGAKEGGGSTVGVLCSIWKSHANRWVDRVVQTDNLRQRMESLVELGTAGYVVMAGANGTLSELAHVWERKTLREMHDRPLVFVGRFWQPLIDLMAGARASSRVHVTVVDSPRELASVFPPL